MSVTLSGRIVNITSILGIVAAMITTICFIRLGVFEDISALRGLAGQFVIFGPVIFMLIQIIQVVIPTIPDGVSYAAGVLTFGSAVGFVYNHVGIALGSIIVFLLDHNCGKPFIMSLVSDKAYNEYIGWLDNRKRFERLFALVIFFPIAPDNALCLMAGLTKTSVREFTLIILLAKPASIYLYSLALIYGSTFLTSLPGTQNK